jgi:hypothetical protein
VYVHTYIHTKYIHTYTGLEDTHARHVFIRAPAVLEHCVHVYVLEYSTTDLHPGAPCRHVRCGNPDRLHLLTTVFWGTTNVTYLCCLSRNSARLSCLANRVPAWHSEDTMSAVSIFASPRWSPASCARLLPSAAVSLSVGWSAAGCRRVSWAGFMNEKLVTHWARLCDSTAAISRRFASRTSSPNASSSASHRRA